MKVKIEKNGKEVVCRFIEDHLDFRALREIDPLVNEALKGAEKAVFDMDKVAFISSAFQRTCLATIKILGRNNLRLINVGEYPMTVLKVSKFDSFMSIEEKK